MQMWACPSVMSCGHVPLEHHVPMSLSPTLLPPPLKNLLSLSPLALSSRSLLSLSPTLSLYSGMRLLQGR